MAMAMLSVKRFREGLSKYGRERLQRIRKNPSMVIQGMSKQSNL